MIKKILVFLLFSLSILLSKTNVRDSLLANIKFAEKSGDSLEISRANYQLGKYLSYNDVAASYKYLFNSLKYNKSMKNNRGTAVVANIIASNYSDEGKHEEALKMYDEALKYALLDSIYKFSAPINLNIAMEYTQLGKHTEALSKKYLALENVIQYNDSANIARYYSEIAKVFYDIGDTAKYIENIDKAYSLINNKKYADFYTRIDVRIEKGYLLKEAKQYEESEKIYQIVYQESKAKNFVGGETSALKNLAELARLRGSYNLAINYLNTSLDIAIEAGKFYEQITTLLRIGTIEVQMKKYRASLKHLNKALKMAKENEYADDQLKCHSMLTTAYKKLGNYSKALNHLMAFNVIRDSLENLKVKEQIAKLESEYSAKEREKEIEILKVENQLKKVKIARQNTIYSVIIIFVLLASTFGYIYNKNRKIQIELEMVRAQQNMLRAQLNPHFIFNSLNAIQSYIMSNNTLASSDYLADYSSLIRLVLEGSREEFLTVEKEIKLIEFYLRLQQLRFNNKFNYELLIDEAIDKEELLIPSMMLQPFIENSIEHGIKCVDNGNITISIKNKNNGIVLSVKDNGIGITDNSEEKKNKKSYAIKITKERIEVLEKLYSKKIEFNINSELEIGTEVEIHIPKQWS